MSFFHMTNCHPVDRFSHVNCGSVAHPWAFCIFLQVCFDASVILFSSVGMCHEPVGETFRNGEADFIEDTNYNCVFSKKILSTFNPMLTNVNTVRTHKGI